MNERANYAKVIWEMASLFQEAKSLKEALRISLEEVVKAVSAETGTIWFYNKKGDGRIYPSYWIGNSDLTNMSLTLGEGIAGGVIKQGTSIIIKDCQKDERWAGHFDEKTGFITKSMICVPLISRYEAVGCIQIINKKDGSLYDEEDLSLCENLATLTAIVMENNHLDLASIDEKPVLISLQNITKSYKKGETEVPILNEINLDIREGEFLVILGEASCGKSTLLNIIGGIEKPTKGSFIFDGKNYAKSDETAMTAYRRNSVGFISQKCNLMSSLTVEENLDFVGELLNNRISTKEALKRVGLLEEEKNYPAQMSNGQKQKLSIARALIKKPRIILADEPTATLDYETSIEVLTIFEKIIQSGITILMTTRNEEIAKMANRVIGMKGGVLLEVAFNRRPLSAKELVW